MTPRTASRRIRRVRAARTVWGAAIGLAVACCGPGVAVVLAPDCPYLFHGISASPPGFDALFRNVLPILGAAGVSPLPADWSEADLDSVHGYMDGDGVPDAYALAMLAAVLCGGDAPVQGQFNANAARFDAFVAQAQSLVSAAAALGLQLQWLASEITAWADSLDPVAWASLKAEALADAESLNARAAEFDAFLGLWTTSLAAHKNWFIAMAGLSTGMKTTMNAVADALHAPLEAHVAALVAGLRRLAAAPQPPMTPTLANHCEMMRLETLPDALLVLHALAWPDFEIYGGVEEPFAAAGDYNHDGRKNLDAFRLVDNGGGGRADYVLAAADGDPFWRGNPALPLPGGWALSCLMLVAGAWVQRRGFFFLFAGKERSKEKR